MMEQQATKKIFTFAVVGNPNAGKSSIFNQLTGLRQKTGNFPGVTVEKKSGKLALSKVQEVKLLDLPGTYSFYPTSQDERIVVQTLSNPADENFPDALLYIADVSKLEKHLLFFTQVRDLGLPVVLALNMSDVAEKEGIQIDTEYLSQQLGVPVVAVSGRTGSGLELLKLEMLELLENPAAFVADQPFYHLPVKALRAADVVKSVLPGVQNTFRAALIAHHHHWLPFLNSHQRAAIAERVQEIGFVPLRQQVEETMTRFDRFTPIVQKAIRHPADERSALTEKLDAVLTHRVAGPILFFTIMFLVFQAIFAWAEYPMTWIEGIFGEAGNWIKYILGSGWLASLLADGILAGLGGVLVFIPQIAILFFLVSILEEVGYMARVAFLFDRLLQTFGMNGRSVVALISGHACAIPAIMSTRTISNWKERLITILVTPLMSCSARIPVYTALIGFVVPATTVGGIFNLQGLAFMGLYLLGIVGALLVALVFKWFLKSDERSFLLLEMPAYRRPVLRNVAYTVWEKVKTFVTEAGRIILVISIILWALASFGPAGRMQQAEQEAITWAEKNKLSETQTDDLIAARQMENSYAGILGKAIEPVIRPLGFDWKIGIALITSFAAREVFVGTMATIYSIGSTNDEFSVRARMAQERRAGTGEPMYNLATALSLLIFYVFAMQCMSTLAVVRRETGSWKWAAVQFAVMSGLAYGGSWVVYQLLS